MVFSRFAPVAPGRILLSLAAILSLVPHTEALTIDELLGSQSAVANQSSPASFVGGTFSGAIGGARKLSLTWLSGANSPVLDTNVVVVPQSGDGTIAFSQDATVAAQCRITWDGTTANAPAANLASSSAGVDLRQDGGNAFSIELLGNDLPTTLEIAVVQADDVSRISRGSVSIDAGGPRVVTIPFASLTGPADLSRAGAISLLLNKNGSQAVDLSLTYIGTNGSCRLVPNAQGRVIDECGVCGGDNSTCADCAGTPNGSAVVDQCGVCGGNGTSCLDCRGVINGPAQLDRCGICEGDGTSCLECVDRDITFTLAQMDASAKSQEALIKIIYQRANQATNRPSTKRNIKRLLEQAHALQIRNWVLSWSVPSINRACANDRFCVNVSNAPILDEYKRNSESLKRMVSDALKLWRKVSPAAARRQTSRYLRLANQQHAENLRLVSVVPATQSVCS